MLWVFTSTVDEQKGVLVDQWNLEGELIGQLFVKFSQPDSHYMINGLNTALVDGYLYKIERDPVDDNFFIVKYKLGNIVGRN